MTLAGVLVALLRDADVRAELVALAREISPAAQPPEAPARLVAAGELARRLGVSTATIRRLDPPHVAVGDRGSRRYDVDAVRAWLAAREPAPTTPATRRRDAVDVGDALAAGGLRVVGGGRS